MYRILPRILQPEFPAAPAATGREDLQPWRPGGSDPGWRSGLGDHAAGRTVQQLLEQRWLPERHSGPAPVMARWHRVAVGRQQLGDGVRSVPRLRPAVRRPVARTTISASGEHSESVRSDGLGGPDCGICPPSVALTITRPRTGWLNRILKGQISRNSRRSVSAPVSVRCPGVPSGQLRPQHSRPSSP